MENFFGKLNTIKKRVYLNPDRKAELRGRLVQYINATAMVRERDVARHSMQRSFFINPFHYIKTMPVAAMIAVLVLIGGGTSFAAEGALPGNILYPVKVHVNEEVRTALTLGAEAKADWASTRAERRLEEAAALAAEGKLNRETRTELENNFKVQAKTATAQISALQASGDVRGAANVASRFEGALHAQVQVLGILRGKQQAKDKDVEPLETHANTVLNSVVGVRTDLEGQIEATSTSRGDEKQVEVRAAAEARLSVAADVILKTQNYIDLKKNKLGEIAVAEAEARLNSASDLMVQGRAKLQAGFYGEAFNLGNRAIRIARETRALIDADIHLNVELKIKFVPKGSAAGQQRKTRKEEDQTLSDATSSREGRTEFNNKDRIEFIGPSTEEDYGGETDGGGTVNVTSTASSTRVHGETRGELRLNLDL